MKRLTAAALLALLVLSPVAATASPDEDDYRCTSIPQKAVADAGKQLDDAKNATSASGLAWRTGQACALIKGALDNAILLKCSQADVIEPLNDLYKKLSEQVRQTNAELNTSARCVYGGGY